MATKLYFHAANSTVSGTLPTATQSGLTITSNVDAQTVNRSMTTTIGAAQTSLVLTTGADVNADTYYFTKFISPKLSGSGTLTAGTYTFSFAAKESNANANFPVTTSAATNITMYVWRPGTGAKVGNILNGNSAAVGEAGTGQTALSCTFTGAAIAWQSGDVIVFEVIFKTTQGNATSRTDTWYYDGTTEASTTNCASFVNMPDTLGFLSPIATVKTLKYALRAQIKPVRTLKYALLRRISTARISLQFNGLASGSGGNYIQTTAAAYTSFTNSITIAAWVKFTGAEGGGANYGGIMDGVNGGSGTNRFLLKQDGVTILLQLWIGSQKSFTGTAGASFTNAWHHFAFTYDNANVQLYFDGAALGSPTAQTGSIGTASAKLSIGWGSGTVYHLAGNIRDVQMWNAALNSTQISDVKNGTQISTNRVGYWPIDENTGSIAKDLAGTIGDATLYNSPTWTDEHHTILYALRKSVPTLKTVKYALKARIKPISTLKYALKARVPTLKTLKYALALRVPSQKTLKYGLRQYILSVKTLVYALQVTALTRVPTVKILKYALVARVATPRTLKYGLKARLAKIETLKYGLKLSVPTLATLKYSLRKAVPTQRTTLYALRKQVPSLRTVKYAINARILAPKIIKYKLTGRIVKLSTLKYALVARVQTPRTLKYALLKQIPTLRTVKYALRLNVVTQKTIKYGLKARLKRVETIVYQLLVTGALSRVYVVRTVKYSLTARLASPQTLKYALRKTLQSSKTLKYNLKSRLASSRVLKYALRSRVQSSKILKYSLLKSILSPRILKYSLKQQIATTTILKYQLSARVQNIRTIKYALRILGELQRLQTRKTIQYSLASYWKRVPKPKGTYELSSEKKDRPRFSLARLLGRQS